MNATTGDITAVAGNDDGTGSADGTGSSALFWHLTGIAADRAGALYAADAGGSNSVRKVQLANGQVTTIAGAKSDFGTVDGIGATAQFNQPLAVAADGQGSVYVAEQNAIRKVAIATGAVTTVVDRKAGLFWGRLVADGTGSLYIADGYYHTVRKVVVSTGEVTIVAGMIGMAQSTDGVGANARFVGPSGIASDGTGNLYVADGRTIRQVALANGAVTTLAGTADTPNHSYSCTDGTGPAAQFDSIVDIAADGLGNLYVTDGCDAVRKFVISTRVVTTLAGKAFVTGSDDGTGSAARFNNPWGIASDGQNSLYVSDQGNDTIRKVDTVTGAVTTVVGSAGHAGVQLGNLPASLNVPTGIAVISGVGLAICSEQAVLVVN
jgi:hypothetical protein